MPERHIGVRENYLRALEFRHPEWIHAEVYLNPSIWIKHGAQLEQLLARYPRLIDDPQQMRLNAASTLAEPIYAEGTYRDDWGCVWRNVRMGDLGQVVEHPLADWSALKAYRPPNPREQYDQNTFRTSAAWCRSHDRPAIGYYAFSKGGFFDRLQFLRGLENLLVDFALEPPEIWPLLEMVFEYNMQFIQMWLEVGVDVVYFHGDIGTQKALLMSPAAFRKYLKPFYKELFSTCRRAGAHVLYSSDGHVLEIVDDLVECGVTLHDPQVRANTIEGIARAYKGKLCALVDIDEQMLPTCTAEDIRAQVGEIIDALAAPAGGLMLLANPTVDVPLGNIEALCSVLEEFGCAT